MKNLFKTLLFTIISTAVFAQNQVSWYKRFEGSIDKYPIVMHLHKMGGKIQGYYYYASRQEPISVSGEVAAAKISLVSYIISAPDVEEKFDLSWQANDLVGKWKNANKTLDVNLKLTDNQPLKFDFVFTTGDTKMFPKKESSPTAEFFAASVWPQGSTPQAEMLKKWIREAFGSKNNEDIGKIFLKQKADFFNQYAKEKVTEAEFKEMGGASLSRSQDSKILVMYQTDKTLSVAKSDYAFEGGAHGNWGYSYTSFDLTKNKALKINDIISPAGQKLLPKILEKTYRKTYKLAANSPLSENLSVEKIEPNDNFYLTSKGICFAYVPYEIAAYAHGQIELFIPFSELTAYLQPTFKP